MVSQPTPPFFLTATTQSPQSIDQMASRDLEIGIAGLSADGIQQSSLTIGAIMLVNSFVYAGGLGYGAMSPGGESHGFNRVRWGRGFSTTTVWLATASTLMALAIFILRKSLDRRGWTAALLRSALAERTCILLTLLSLLALATASIILT
ncbi:hypothetical protein FRC02_001370 [Tulasnella sp. 418]|nr:hypothetical protein FRC02_001370 [Tulasnella sp. 418]